MPIDIATGNVELDREDFELPGRVPIKWIRSYRSHLLDQDLARMGRGWTNSWFPSFRRADGQWIFTNRSGDDAIFEDPRSEVLQGKTLRLLDAFLELRMNRGLLEVLHWDVDTSEIERFVFQPTRTGVSYQLHEIQNVSGDAVQLQWDSMGRLESLYQKIEERRVLVRYTNSGQIDSLLLESDPAKKPFVRYEYDKSGRLMAAWNRRELAHRYEYDEKSRLKREMLPDGAIYSYRYDEKGRCIHFTGLDRYNEKKLRFLDPVGTTIVTNSYGQIRTYKSLPSGKIISEQSPTGATKQTNYDEYGRIAEKIDELGAVTKYTYDSFGNRDSITDALGNVTKFTYNDSHQPTLMIDAAGHPWKREYDESQRISATENPLGARWQIDYDFEGNPVEITEPQGFKRRQRFERGMPLESTDFMGHQSKFDWDVGGRLIERTGQIGEKFRFRYDASGNLIQVDRPDGSLSRATYDAGENLSSFMNAKGHTIQYRYGSCRRLLERKDAIGRSVHYEWGTEPDRLDAVINEKGERFSYVRDDEGRIILERSFDGREHRFAHDAAGRVIAFINGNNERIQYKHDPLGRLVEQTLPTGEKTTFAYDPIGRILAAINPDSEVKFDFDLAGRLVCENQNEHWVRTEYNLTGEVIRVSSSLDHEVKYELDPNGRPTKLTTANDQSLAFERDPRGLEIARDMQGEMRMEQRFDSIGRLLEQRVGRKGYHGTSTSVGANPSHMLPYTDKIQRNYSYDDDGLLLATKDGQWGKTEYAYDPADRLLSAFLDRGISEQFEYDATDNLTRMRQQNGESDDVSLTYHSGNRIQQRGDTIYEHDLDGRLIKKIEYASSSNPQIWHYFWNAQGQLRGLRRPEGVVWQYKYDAFGRRVAKLSEGVSLAFVWDGNALLHETNGTDRNMTWIMKQSSFVPVALVLGSELYSVICDQIGTPTEALDATGTISWTNLTTVWGTINHEESSSQKIDCCIRFQGQYYDQESGLHYSRFRYYDPLNARFVSADPARLHGGENLYQYVSNPLQYIDPFGLGSGKDCGDPVPEDDPNRPQLPPYDGVTTHGVLITNEGHIVPLTSGGADPRYRNYPTAGHVEGKAALYIRENGSTGGIVYHNNPNGTCGYCNTQTERLLPPGATLIVVPPANATANNPSARSTPTGYIGDSTPLKPPK